MVDKTRRLQVRELYRVVRVTEDEAVLKQVTQPVGGIASDFWQFQDGAELRISPPWCYDPEEAIFDHEHIVRELTADGLGVTPVVARSLNMTAPELVFVRNDGWSVGVAGDRAARQALDMWGHRFVQFARKVDGWKLRSIADYLVKSVGEVLMERTCSCGHHRQAHSVGGRHRCLVRKGCCLAYVPKIGPREGDR